MLQELCPVLKLAVELFVVTTSIGVCSFDWVALLFFVCCIRLVLLRSTPVLFTVRFVQLGCLAIADLSPKASRGSQIRLFLCIPFLFSLYLVLFIILLSSQRKKYLMCVGLTATSQTSHRKVVLFIFCFSSKLQVSQQGWQVIRDAWGGIGC